MAAASAPVFIPYVATPSEKWYAEQIVSGGHPAVTTTKIVAGK